MGSVPIVCLMGPTASGKTQLAVQLVQKFPFEIISVDSAMVYRGMNIGTAKPDAEILKVAPHHLIDIRDPADAYSAAQFQQDALREIDAIIAKKKIPLLVGGTMLYFHALQNGLSDLPTADPVVREKLRQEGEQLGWIVLHERLKKIDSVAAERIHSNDSQRLQRALEVYELTGRNLTSWLQEKTKHPSQPLINLALAPSDRAVLHNRIEKRFKQMLQEGLIDEVQTFFLREDLTLDTPSMRSVGYRQVWDYLLGNSSYEEMQEKGIISTRQLAKRQLTWLRSWPGLKFFESEDKDILDQLCFYLDKTSLRA